MFDAVSDGFAPLRFSLFVKPCAYTDESMSVEAVLANEGILKDGTYTADLAIENDEGVVTKFTERFSLRKEDFATPIVKRDLDIKLPVGKYRLTANLREGVAAADSTEFWVFERPSALLTEVPFYTVDMQDEEFKALQSVLPSVRPYAGEADGVILVGNADTEAVEALIDKAAQGATVVFLDKEPFFKEENVKALHAIDDGLAFKNYLDWLYHRDYLLLSRKIFAGIEGKLARLSLFGPVFANQSFGVGRAPDSILCPGFLTGYYGVEGGYASTHAMLGYRHGTGRVYLNTFNLLSQTGHPVADRILHNFLSMLIAE